MLISSNLYTAYQITDQNNLLHTCSTCLCTSTITSSPLCAAELGKQRLFPQKVSQFSTCPILLFLIQNFCLVHVLVDQMNGYSTLHQFIECEASWGMRRNSNDIVEN